MIRTYCGLFVLLAGLGVAGCKGNLNDGNFPLTTTDRVSLTAGGLESNGNSNQSSISGDGRYIVFTTLASNLVPGDDGLFTDIYLRDINPASAALSTTVRVSVSTTGGNPNGNSSTPVISADGNFVVFFSLASNLVTADANAAGAVYRWNRQTGVIDRVSQDTAGGDTNAACSAPAVSENGQFAVFHSTATDLEGGAASVVSNIYRRNMNVAATTPGATLRISRDALGGEPTGGSFNPSISGDARYVAFMSSATDLVSTVTPEVGAFNDIYVCDANTGIINRVSNDFTGTGEINLDASNPAISRDGNWVVFETSASNLLPVGVDTNGARDIFRVARTGGASTRVSVNSAGGQALNAAINGNTLPTISGDGRFVVFQTDCTNLFPGDGNSVSDVVIRDTLLQSTFAISVQTGGGHTESGGNSAFGRVSADGQFVSFHSNSIVLAGDDLNSAQDVFRRGKIPQ
jgi:Tol biopolymer transport system component